MAAPDDCDRVDSSVNHLCKLIKVPSVLIVSNLPFVRLPGWIVPQCPTIFFSSNIITWKGYKPSNFKQSIFDR